MNLRWKLEAPQIALITLMFLVTALTWSALPEAIPVHWNVNGEIDRYGSKVEGLLLTPAIALGLYVLLAWLPSLDPHRESYAAFVGAYAAIRVATLLMLTGVHTALVLTAAGYAVAMDRVIPSLIGILFVIVGLAMGHVQPNWFVGVRTPWTLSSATAWAQTHQASRWVFVAAGFAFLVAAVFPSLLTVLASATLLLVGVIGLVAYSYIVWRNAPDRKAERR